MLAEIGFFALLFALITSLYAAGASAFGAWKRDTAWIISGRNATFVTFLLMTISIGSLATALMQQEYHINYVRLVSSPDMTDFFRFTSLWGSQAGSLLFWSFIMSAFTVGAVVTGWKRYRRLMPYTIVYLMVVLAFFLSLSIFIENPFERTWVVNRQLVDSVLRPAGAVMPSQFELESSARGLNPLLRHFGMAIHPPMLYLGFVGFIIPFAFAMAALASGDLSTNWIKASRRWLLGSWLFLSLGLILGGRWAYDVLGWGGYWGWDPVENAAFLPWLMGTALLHSVMIEEKRGMLRVWNMILVIATFSAVIFGTFATRSGLVESVHSFAKSGIGIPMFSFWFLLTIIGAVLIFWRHGQGKLRDDHGFKNLLSRESLFVLNNFVFLALFVAIFWGSFGAPIISELFLETDITLGTDYFMKVTPPLFGALYILMAVAPLSAYGMTSVKRLGRSLLIPVGLAVGTGVLLVLNGMTRPVSIFAFFIVALAGWVAIYEAFRAVSARSRTHHENPISAFGKVLIRNPHRYGGYMIHLGVAIIGIGIIGSTLYQVETQRTLSVGESVFIEDYELRYDRFDSGQISVDQRVMDIANLTVLRDGKELAKLRPRRDFFPNAQDMNSMTIAGAYSTIENDFYVLLVSWDEISEARATFKIYINPLVNLIWWGGLVLIAGTVIAVYPNEVLVKRPHAVTAPQGVEGARL